MGLEEALFVHLRDDSALDALIDGRVFPVRVPEGADLPAIAYQRISAPRSYTHDNAGGVGTVLVVARIQFSCWGPPGGTADEVIAVARALIAAVSGFKGVMGADEEADPELEGLNVQAALVDFELDDYEADTTMFRRLVDVKFTHEEG